MGTTFTTVRYLVALYLLLVGTLIAMVFLGFSTQLIGRSAVAAASCDDLIWR